VKRVLRDELVWGLPVALALLLALWTLGEGGAVPLAVFQILGAVVVLLLALRAASRDAPAPVGPAINFLSAALLALAALSILTAANRGIAARNVATLVSVVALMHAAARVPRRISAFLVAGQVALVLPIAVSAVLEPLGAGWLPSHDYFPGRAMANMGGPGPLGSLLAAVIPIAAALLMTSRRRSIKVLAGAGLALLVAALTATFSRAGMLAMGAGLVVLVALFARDRGARTAVRWAACILVLIAIIVPSYNALVLRLAPEEYAAGTRPGTQTFEIARVIEGTDLTNAGVRRLCWKTGVAAIAEKPLTGIGPGCFGIAYGRLAPDGLERVAASRGHLYHYTYNDYLQIGAEMGLPALVCFLALLVAVGMAARTRPPAAAPSGRFETAARYALTAGLAAILTQALIDFPLHLPSHATLFWVDLGLLLSLTRAGHNGRGVAGNDEPAARDRATGWCRAGIALAALVAVWMSTVAVREALAERSALAAVRHEKAGDTKTALGLAQSATELAPHEHTYWVLLAETANGIGTHGEVDTVFRAYEEAARAWPDHAPTHGRMGALYLTYVGDVPDALEHALTNLRLSIALNPYYADPHTNLGTVLMATGDTEGARAEFVEAAGLDTLAAAPLFNLGNLEASVGRHRVAEGHYLEALSREPDHAGSLANLGAVLLGQERYDEALPFLERAHELDPGSHRILGLLTMARQGPRR